MYKFIYKKSNCLNLGYFNDVYKTKYCYYKTIQIYENIQFLRLKSILFYLDYRNKRKNVVSKNIG